MKKIISILLSIVLVVSTFMIGDRSVNAETTDWQMTAIVSPENGKLAGAGYIDIIFETTLKDAKSYDVYVDGVFQKSFVADENVQTQKCEIYTTKVKAHTAYIEATLENDSKVRTETVTFYVSKKGIAIGADMSSTVKLNEMNLSWYYNWNTSAFNSIVDDGVAHVPMVWGGEQDNIDGIADISNNAKYILGFNEPDLEAQANLTPEEALQIWPLIQAKGTRTVSPASMNPNGPSDWLTTFLEGIDSDELLSCDSVAVHCYGGIIDVQRALKAIDAMWNTYHKPIWVTEISIMGKKGTASDHSYEKPGERQLMAAYLEELVKELDARDYVERYSWFPYNIDSSNEIDGLDGCGATALFDYETGGLTELGVLYASIGNPEGYKVSEITNFYEEPTTQKPTQNVTTQIPTKNDSDANKETKITVKKPTRVQIKSAKNIKKKSVSLIWKKTSNAKKYQMQYSTSKKFKAGKKYKTKIVTTKKTKFVIKKLSNNKKYYFRVRGINGEKMGIWSKVKKVIINK